MNENENTRNAREATVKNLKMQAIMCNYGLPENAAYLGWDKLSVDDARQEFKAIRELWVRLDLFVTTGESSKGAIDFPEAKRRIEYNLIGKRPENSSVLFKSLVPARRRR